jgi:hypothetical protein
MRQSFTLHVLFVALGLLPALAAADADEDSAIDWASGRIRIEYDNDLLLNSDDRFTSGFSLQWHSRPTENWSAVRVPSWMKFGNRLPGMRADGRYYRVGLAVGQNMQTPSDLSATEPISDDVPYAGSLGAELNWLAFDDDALTGYALIVGVIGPASGAEPMQKWIHDLIGADRPMGWDNQLPNEPAINFNGMHRRKFARVTSDTGRWSADAAWGAHFGLGTALTFAEASLGFRAGFNVPTGFAFLPDPVGRGVAYDATIKRLPDSEVSVYLSLVHRRTYMQHFIFVDGSLFQDTPSIAADRWQYQTIVGLHLVRNRWGIHFSIWDGSANLDRVPGDEGNDFGTIAFEWRF